MKPVIAAKNRPYSALTRSPSNPAAPAALATTPSTQGRQRIEHLDDACRVHRSVDIREGAARVGRDHWRASLACLNLVQIRHDDRRSALPRSVVDEPLPSIHPGFLLCGTDL